MCLVVHFPLNYPDENSPPTFVFAKGTTLDPQARSHILKALRQTASEKVKQNCPCLNPCLRQLETLLAELSQASSGKVNYFRLKVQSRTMNVLHKSMIYDPQLA